MVQTGANGDGETVSIGLEAYPSRFWAYVAIALLSLLLLTFLMKDYPLRRLRQELSKRKGRFSSAAVQRGADKALCAVLHVRRGGHHGGVFPVFYHARQDAEQRQPHPYDPYSLNGGKDLGIDTSDCRIDVYDGMDNQAMFFQMPTIQAFHSIVPGSVMEFYPTIGIQRDVATAGRQILRPARADFLPLAAGPHHERRYIRAGWGTADARLGVCRYAQRL